MRAYRIAALSAALVAGLAAAYITTATATGPVTLPDLPGLGYSLGLRVNVQDGCQNYWVLSGHGAPETLIGDWPPHCSTAADEQGRIDALLAAYPPVSATTTTAAPTVSTVYETTTVQASPLPAVTVTTPAETPLTVTITQPVERTVTETVVQTVTVEAPPPVAPLDPPWLAALAARSAGLNELYAL